MRVEASFYLIASVRFQRLLYEGVITSSPCQVENCHFVRPAMHDIQNRRHTSFNTVCTPSMRGLRRNQIGENVRNHTFVNRVSRAMLKHFET